MKAKCRFHRDYTIELVTELEPQIKRASQRWSVPPLLQVFMTLEYLASNIFMDTVGELFGVDKSTASRVICRVVELLYRKAGDEVCFHDEETTRKPTQEIYQQFGLPNIVGLIDGILVKIARPIEDEEGYIGGKLSNHSTYR